MTAPGAQISLGEDLSSPRNFPAEQRSGREGTKCLGGTWKRLENKTRDWQKTLQGGFSHFFGEGFSEPGWNFSSKMREGQIEP